MKKTLIALAVFGTFSGAALANGNNVQLYGLIDMGVTHFDGISNGKGGTTSSTGVSSGVQSGSRIGLKGTEDLGGGMSVFFDAETGFCAAGTTQAAVVGSGKVASGGYCTGGGFMQRQSYVGLQGDFGQVIGGRMYNADFNNEANMDPFGYGLTGDIGNMGLAGARSDQVLAYVTPNLSGFTGVAAYVFSINGTVANDAAASTSNVPRAWTVNGEYDNGPITAGLNYTQATNVTQASAAAVNDGKMDLYQIYGAYNFGVAKVSGIYEHQKMDYYNGANKFWMLGLTVPVGPGSILASYSERQNDMSTTTAPAVTSQGTAKQYAIGYTYSLSKQTNLYASYAHISNNAATATQVGTAFAVGDSTDGFTGVTGQSSTGLAVGIRHQF